MYLNNTMHIIDTKLKKKIKREMINSPLEKGENDFFQVFDSNI